MSRYREISTDLSGETTHHTHYANLLTISSQFPCYFPWFITRFNKDLQIPILCLINDKEKPPKSSDRSAWYLVDISVEVSLGLQ